MKGTLKDRVNPGGFCVAATYVLIVVVIFTFTASTTKPSNVGYDWIPFILLSMPWYAINQRLLLPGLIANAGLMYSLGTLLQFSGPALSSGERGCASSFVSQFDDSRYRH